MRNMIFGLFFVRCVRPMPVKEKERNCLWQIFIVIFYNLWLCCVWWCMVSKRKDSFSVEKENLLGAACTVASCRLFMNAFLQCAQCQARWFRNQCVEEKEREGMLRTVWRNRMKYAIIMAMVTCELYNHWAWEFGRLFLHAYSLNFFGSSADSHRQKSYVKWDRASRMAPTYERKRDGKREKEEAAAAKKLFAIQHQPNKVDKVENSTIFLRVSLTKTWTHIHWL